MGLLRGIAKLAGKAVKSAAAPIITGVAIHTAVSAHEKHKERKLIREMEQSTKVPSAKKKKPLEAKRRKKSDVISEGADINPVEISEKKPEVKKDEFKNECLLVINSEKIYLKCLRKTITYEINEHKYKKNYIGYLNDSPVARIDVGYEYVSIDHHLPSKRRNDERNIHIEGMTIGTLQKDSTYDCDVDSETPKWQCCLGKWTINFDINNKEIRIKSGKKEFFTKSSETEGFAFKYFAKNLYESILFSALILATIDSLRIDEWHYSYSETLYSPF